MADVSGFDPNTPSGTSQILDGDDKIRSIQSDLKAVWEEEHFFQDGSAASGGVHKLGSARASYASTSNISRASDDGRLAIGSESGMVWDISADKSRPLPAGSLLPTHFLGSNSTFDGRRFVIEVAGTDVGKATGLDVIYQNVLGVVGSFELSQITQGFGGSVKTLAGIDMDWTASASTTTVAAAGSWTDGSEITPGNLVPYNAIVFGFIDESDMS